MKFICLGYLEESKWEEMAETDSLSETLRERMRITH
jgi:hypothetical protein